MKKYLLLFLFCASLLQLFAQTENEFLINGEKFTIVETMPEFPGGEQKMLEFVYGKIKYPAKAKKRGIEGLVVLGFTVNEDGSISDVEVLRDIGAGCGKEAKRVIESMPNWSPGIQKGKAVKVAYKFPINFKL